MFALFLFSLFYVTIFPLYNSKRTVYILQGEIGHRENIVCILPTGFQSN
jgi:hypothetical protein